MKIALLSDTRSTVLRHTCVDLDWGFKKLGHECEIFHGDTKWCDFSGEADDGDWMAFLDEFKPDAIMQLDGLRYHLHPLVRPPDSVVWVCWLQDRFDYLYRKEFVSQLGERDINLASCEEYCEEFEAAGYPKVSKVMIGANTDFFNLDLEPKQERFDCDLAMIMRMPGIMKVRDQNRIKVAQMCKETGLRFKIFGKGWEKTEFKDYYCGEIEAHSKDLKACYQQAGIVVHVNDDINYHMRTLEALASGGRVAIWRGDKWIDSPSPPAFMFRDSSALRSIHGSLAPVRKSELEVGHKWVRENHSYVQRCAEIVNHIQWAI